MVKRIEIKLLFTGGRLYIYIYLLTLVLSTHSLTFCFTYIPIVIRNN